MPLRVLLSRHKALPILSAFSVQDMMRSFQSRLWLIKRPQVVHSQLTPNSTFEFLVRSHVSSHLVAAASIAFCNRWVVLRCVFLVPQVMTSVLTSST